MARSVPPGLGQLPEKWTERLTLAERFLPLRYCSKPLGHMPSFPPHSDLRGKGDTAQGTESLVGLWWLMLRDRAGQQAARVMAVLKIRPSHGKFWVSGIFCKVQRAGNTEAAHAHVAITECYTHAQTQTCKRGLWFTSPPALPHPGPLGI